MNAEWLAIAVVRRLSERAVRALLAGDVARERELAAELWTATGVLRKFRIPVSDMFWIDPYATAAMLAADEDDEDDEDDELGAV